MKSDLTDKKIINQYRPKSIKPTKSDFYKKDHDEDSEKSTISDLKFNKKDKEKNIPKKNKKLQVEIENYNKNHEKLSKRIESL